MPKINTIGIAGAGTMGAGIAQVAALAGYKVIVYDVAKKALDKGKQIVASNLRTGVEKGKLKKADSEKALSSISWTSSLKSLKADLIIEAVKEDLGVKRKLFTQLAAINNKNTIFATNTSSIPITRIAASISHPERVVGMHFFNPAHLMKLVEVISSAETSEVVTALVKVVAEKMGKTVILAKDSPGFIVNRVARPYYVEGLKLLEENVAPLTTIDTLLESSGFKMGPFRLIDLLGVDNNFAVTVSMYNSFHQESRFRPSRIQQQKVDAGHHGRKTGKGFYDYD